MAMIHLVGLLPSSRMSLRIPLWADQLDGTSLCAIESSSHPDGMDSEHKLLPTQTS